MARVADQQSRSHGAGSSAQLAAQQLTRMQKKRLRAKKRQQAKKEMLKATKATDSKAAASTATTSSAASNEGEPAVSPFTEHSQSPTDVAAVEPAAAPDSQANSATASGASSARAATPVGAHPVSSPEVLSPTDILAQPCSRPHESSYDRHRLFIADLGNGCWRDKHFTDDVTTRQYRAPEILVGLPWDVEIDIFSLACLVFEMVTGDYLFDPKADVNGEYSRSEDHLALMSELLGSFPRKLTSHGQHSHAFFRKSGELRRIAHLDPWSLMAVLTDKYKLPPEEAQLLSSFLLPMLALDPKQRASARQSLHHPWLTADPESDAFAQRFDADFDHKVAAAIISGHYPKHDLPSLYPETRSSEQILANSTGHCCGAEHEHEHDDDEEEESDIEHHSDDESDHDSQFAEESESEFEAASNGNPNPIFKVTKPPSRDYYNQFQQRSR